MDPTSDPTCDPTKDPTRDPTTDKNGDCGDGISVGYGGKKENKCCEGKEEGKERVQDKYSGTEDIDDGCFEREGINDSYWREDIDDGYFYGETMDIKEIKDVKDVDDVSSCDYEYYGCVCCKKYDWVGYGWYKQMLCIFCVVVFDPCVNSRNWQETCVLYTLSIFKRE